MNASELNRKLLYYGHNDVADYLQNSPLNRYLYKQILNNRDSSNKSSVVTIFNEIYYQCVCVAFDINPGENLMHRYIEEEIWWLKSRNDAVLVFFFLWVLLKAKRTLTFNEECFLESLTSILKKSENVEDSLEALLRDMKENDIKVPDEFAQMRYPVVKAIPGLRMYIESGQVVYKALSDEDMDNVKEWIEVESFGVRETLNPYINELENLAKQYQQERDEARKQCEEQRKTYEMELARWEAKYENTVKELEEKGRAKETVESAPNELALTISEMAVHVKERFSKAGAEEFITMYYRLAMKHGDLDEETCKMIDGIVPAIIKLFDCNNVDKLRHHYVGFLVLRPLLSRCIGRNVISPMALEKKKDEKRMSICDVTVTTSVCGASVSVKGFPHCSQDMETMSCAESTLWAIMEYYSYKSPLHKLILPSEIHSVLASTTKERQLPSHGLLFEQISNVLCHSGFECVIYSNEEWKNSDITFKEVFSCYVESGIPLAVCIETADKEYHAVVCIGKQDTDPKNILNGNPLGASLQGWNFNRWNKCLEDFVFSDDNRPCYQRVSFEKPTECYDDPVRWGDGRITHFIAPLPKKVYIDAKSAIAISNSFLTDVKGLPKGTCVRTFLTSCQSFTDFIVSESDWSDEGKSHFVGLKMPKYIWVTEFSELNTFQSGLADGLLILDATGQTDTSSMIYYRTKDSVTYYDDYEKRMVELSKTDGKATKLYSKNLNTY